MELPLSTRLFQAISRCRHAGWYRGTCNGACPHQGSRFCDFMDTWQEQAPLMVRVSQSDVRSHLIDATTIGCFDDGHLANKRLCALHVAQAAWRTYGASCIGDCCARHVWPTREVAPLLYIPHTTPTQAVVLLHFGLFTEQDVSRLISTSLEVAILVTHLLHHKGTGQLVSGD